jgi:hypothetical protein
VTGGLLRFEWMRTDLLPPRNVYAAETAKPKAGRVDPGLLGRRAKDMLLQVAIIGRQAIPILATENEAFDRNAARFCVSQQLGCDLWRLTRTLRFGVLIGPKRPRAQSR